MEALKSCDVCGIVRERGERWFDCLYDDHQIIADRLSRPGQGDGICKECITEHGICKRCRETEAA